jgi:hypothetical protein
MPPATSVLAAAPSHHGEVTRDRGSWGADLARPPDKGAWFLSQDSPIFGSGVADGQLSPATLQYLAVGGSSSLALVAHVAVTVAVIDCQLRHPRSLS